MIFSRPELLPLLCVPVLFAFWQWFARGQPLALPMDFTQIRRRPVLDVFIRGLGFLPAGLLACTILLWAGPLIEGPPTYPAQVTNIQIALDTSGSMNEPFGDRTKPDGKQFTRFDAAMEAISEFTTDRPGDAFGFSIFTSKVIHWVPLTKDLAAIRMATPFVRPGTFPLRWWDGTKVGNAMLSCAELLEQRHEGDRMLIVLSDGESDDLLGDLATQVGQTLKSKKIIVHSISVRTQAPLEGMRRVSQITGGQMFESGDSAGLREVFRQIDQLQRAKLVSAQTQWLEYLRPIALVGLALLVLQQIATFGLRFTPW